MRGELNLLFAFGAFVASVAVIVGLGLFVLTVVLRVQARHRKRLARVGRRRGTAQLDIDAARMQLLRRKEETNLLLSLTSVLSRFLPVLDSDRLTANLRRAGLTLSMTSFVLVALLVGAVLAFAGKVLTGYPIALILPSALLGGMLLVDALVRLRGDMMAERFMRKLPEALDTIIRGARAGLPVIECIAGVGEEFEDPVGGYFRTVAERVQLGEPLDVALWRVADIVDRPEMDFLAVSIAIQTETGGSLTEALGNLADLLRKREAMKLKIKAISAEAKASALIIGALPFVMLGLLMLTNPDYAMTLFTDPRGQMMVAFGLASIGVGALVMWRMTRFEI